MFCAEITFDTFNGYLEIKHQHLFKLIQYICGIFILS